MAEQYPKTIVLPRSGKTATIERRPKGRDLRLAERAAGRKADAMQKMYAMLAQLVLLDGKPVVMEDFDDMDLGELNEIMRACGLLAEDDEEDGGEKKSLTQPPSQASSNGDSHPAS